MIFYSLNNASFISDSDRQKYHFYPAIWSAAATTAAGRCYQQ